MILDYRLARRASASATRLAKADAAAIRYSLFPGDAILRDGDVDLSARWGWVPVLDFAFGVAWVAQELAQRSAVRFEFTESDAQLTFERHGDLVEIRATYAPGTLRAPYDEFRDLSSAFARRVVAELAATHRGLLQHPEIQRLLAQLG